MKKLLSYTYNDLICYLINKYGPVPYDYFRNKNCKSKQSKNSRTNEGLVIHHIDEDKYILLSNSNEALLQSYSYQKADRLVYCNMIEHLILHIKIAEERVDKHSGVGIGGCKLILQQINSWISHGRPSGWRGYLYDNVKSYIENSHVWIINEDVPLSDYCYIILYLFDLIWNDDVYKNPNELLFFHPLELARTYNKYEFCFNVDMLLYGNRLDYEMMLVEYNDASSFCDCNMYEVKNDNQYVRYRNENYDINLLYHYYIDKDDYTYVLYHKYGGYVYVNFENDINKKLNDKVTYNADLYFGFE